MVYRHDLVPHFEWLAGSEYYDEALDEALVAIAMAAHGHEHDLVNFGAAWVMASYNVERYDLEQFVERARSEWLLPPGDDPALPRTRDSRCHAYPGDVKGTPDLVDVQARLERFRDERDWGQFHSPGNLAKAIAVEAAELLELFLWADGEREGEVLGSRRAEVEAELADVLIQCLNFASVAGIDVIDAVRRKIDSNAEKYPVSEWKGRAGKAGA